MSVKFWTAFLQTTIKETTLTLTLQLIKIMQSFFCTQPTGGGQALCVWHGVSSSIKTVPGTFRAYAPCREAGLLASKTRLLGSRHFGDRVLRVPGARVLTLEGVVTSPRDTPPPSTIPSSALRDPGSRRSHSTRVSTLLLTLSLPSFAYWKVSLCGRSSFGELLVFHHTVPRSDWEGHGFTSNIGLRTGIQRPSLSGSDCSCGLCGWWGRQGHLRTDAHSRAWIVIPFTQPSFLIYKSDVIIPNWQSSVTGKHLRCRAPSIEQALGKW